MTSSAAETSNAAASAKTRAYQMPSMSSTMGSTSTANTRNTSVRRKEIAAEMAPLFNAVKNAEEKMLKPHSRKENAYSYSEC